MNCQAQQKINTHHLQGYRNEYLVSNLPSRLHRHQLDSSPPEILDLFCDISCHTDILERDEVINHNNFPNGM